MNSTDAIGEIDYQISFIIGHHVFVMLKQYLHIIGGAIILCRSVLEDCSQLLYVAGDAFGHDVVAQRRPEAPEQ